jgi:uncharacterized membrane protein
MSKSGNGAIVAWLRRLGPTRLLVFPPLFIAAVSLPMALRIVPPNGVYGLRTARTLSSPEIWYASNFRAGAAGVVLGILGALIVLAIMRSRSMSDVTKALLAGATAVIVAMASAAAGLLAA